jgi:hypothetical protein
MALQSAIPVDFTAYFPNGAAIISETAEAVALWEDGKNVGQAHDKTSGKPLWSVRVIDLDGSARKGQSEVVVKIPSATEPQLPPTMTGLPLRPVVFDDLSVTPYVQEGTGRPRVAFSLRASSMKQPPARKSES